MTAKTLIPAQARIQAWPNEELALLRQLAAQGHRVAAIALKLGRSYCSVTYKARREGISFASFSRRQPAATVTGSTMNTRSKP
jgi:hypothetical protein